MLKESLWLLLFIIFYDANPFFSHLWKVSFTPTYFFLWCICCSCSSGVLENPCNSQASLFFLSSPCTAPSFFILWSFCRFSLYPWRAFLSASFTLLIELSVLAILISLPPVKFRWSYYSFRLLNSYILYSCLFIHWFSW